MARGIVSRRQNQTDKRVRDVAKPTLKMLSEIYQIGESTIGDIVQQSPCTCFSVRKET
ncbi:hypothetical protein DPMN_024574 [Dreissena polymorpha]|uniref:Uncharacterized protein n=1 Tax=Dreissena polymorpha TaxID=45954 RepID=A0A9D4LP58_DREPO|nr:hypothetical protein DPMN_024574 [Dreissena polymorpha]